MGPNVHLEAVRLRHTSGDGTSDNIFFDNGRACVGALNGSIEVETKADAVGRRSTRSRPQLFRGLGFRIKEQLRFFLSLLHGSRF